MMLLMLMVMVVVLVIIVMFVVVITKQHRNWGAGGHGKKDFAKTNTAQRKARTNNYFALLAK